MNFELTNTQQMIQETARKFAREVIAPIAAKLDEEGRYPTEIIKQLFEMGFMSLMVPDSLGGAGLDAVSYVIAMEEISAACASCGVIMSVNNSLYLDPVMKFGNDEQKKQFATPMIDGSGLGCFMLSEPGTGSDAANQQTVARREGDHYIINGTKNWITNAPQATHGLVFVMTDKDKKVKGITAFLVPMNHPGISVGPKEHKLGIRASGCASVIFEDCKVPASWILGKENEGFKVAMSTLDGGRIGIAAQALGIARAAFEESAKYSTQRHAFGKPISQLQSIQWKLADMATRVDAARLLTYHAATLKDKGAKYTKESAMAKLYASEAASFAADEGLQIYGGYGYIKEFPAERHLRDARITRIYEGTSEIQRLVIATQLLSE
jgi:butyryl-CoA dehydrogenase